MLTCSFTNKEIEDVNIVLKYYKETLSYDAIAKIEFDKENQLIRQKYEKIDLKNKYFFHECKYSEDNENLKNEKKRSIEKLVRYYCLKHIKKLKKEYDNYKDVDIFNFYYAPIMIPYRYKHKNSDKIFYFAPFYVKINLQNEIEEYLEYIKKHSYYPNSLIAYHIALDRLHNYLNIDKNQENIENVQNGKNKSKINDIEKQDFFGNSYFEISTKLFESQFNILDNDFIDRFKNKLEKIGKNLKIETFNDLKDVMNIFFETLYSKNEKNIQKNIKLFLQDLHEHIQLITTNDYKIEFMRKENKKGTDAIYHTIFVVNMQDIGNDSFNYGVLKLYDQIIDDKRIQKCNLLYKFFVSSPLANSFANRTEDKKTDEKQKNNYKILQLPLKERLKLSQKQLGAFDVNYPLTQSQRYCLQVAKSNLDVIPVNGPPGTGKTSLLRAFVADYTIENALNIIEQYKKNVDNKKSFSNFEFFPPIVSFSTNNRALQNIIEGVSKGFKELKKEGRYYTRWLNPKLELEKSITLEEFELYVPMLKTKIDKKNKIITTVILEDIRNDIVANLNKYIENYLKIAKENLKGFDSRINIQVNNKRRLLENVFDLLKKEVEKEVENIKKSLNSNIHSKLNYFEKNLEILKDIVNLKNDREFLREIERFTKTQIEMGNVINKLQVSIVALEDHIDKYEKNYAKIENDFRITINQINSSKDIEKEKIKSDIEKERKIEKERLSDKINELLALQRRKSNTLKEIDSELKENEEKLNSLILRLIDKFNQKLTDKINELKRKKFNIREDIKDIKQEIKYINNKIRNIENGYNQKIDELFEKIDENYKQKEKEINEKFKQNIEQIDKNINEIIYNFGYDSIDKAKEATGLFKSLNKKYIGYEDVLNEAEKVNSELDINKRLKLFFTSIHLLEAALLLKFYDNDSVNLSRRCPKCYKNNAVVLTNSTTLEHKECGFRLKTFKKFNKNDKDGILMTENEIKKILIFRTIVYDYNIFELEENKKDRWYNVNKIDSWKYKIKYEVLNDLTAIFPLINTTAHSFFSVFSRYDESIGKKVLPEAYFDFLLVDEAGMVLPSLMVNLYAGKKVLLFGDTKQIEPVYPFSGNEMIDKIIMDKYANSIEHRDLLLEKYSVLKQNAMSIANKSIYIEDENAIRADENAPLWLLQHFRCAKSIIEFCNKLVYNGKIEPKNEDDQNFKHLDFISHDRNMNLANNTNKYEAELVIEKIEEFMKQGINAEDIGVITPYRRQADLISKALMNKGIDINKLYVGTVHKFQGSERDIIIFSTSSGKNYQGNSKDLFMNRDNGNMLNVAVSRAKKCFILIGCPEAISDSNSYSGKLVTHINSYKESFIM